MRRVAAAALLCFFLAGCICTLPPMPEMTPTPTPIHTPTPTPTPAPTPQVTPPPANYSEIEQKVFNLTNVERVNHSLAPFAQSSGHAGMARYQSCCLASHNILEHESEECGTLEGRMELFALGLPVAENLARVPDARLYYATNGSPYDLYTDDEVAANIVDGWMNSPGHRANILDSDLTTLGVGVCKEGYYFYATQNFGGG